jgi:uncharacterized membrane protein
LTIENRKRTLVVVVVLTLVAGIFFRFYRLDGKVFWEDEILGAIHMLGYTEAEIVEGSPHIVDAQTLARYVRPDAGEDARPYSATVRSLALEDPQHPPLYYLISRFWTSVFGASASGQRSLAAVFGVLALPCVYLLCLELFGSLEIALVALLLVALSPLWVLYAQEAREYSLWSGVIALDAWLFLRACRLGGWPAWLGYGALTALALYIYPLTGLAVIGFGAYLLIRERRLLGAFAGYLVASVAALVAFIPWLIAMRSSGGLERGMAVMMNAHLSPAAVASIFVRNLRFPFVDLGAFRLGPLGSTAVNLGLTVLVLALIAYALVCLVRQWPFRVWGFVLVGLCAPMMLLLGRDLVVSGHFVYQARYFMPLLLGIQIAVAAVFGRALFDDAPSALRGRVFAALLVIVVAGELLSCVVSSRAATWWNKAYERNRAVAQIVNAAAQPVVVSNYYTPSVLALAFYLDPKVSMRLGLRCAQCGVDQGSQTALEAPLPASGSVFLLQSDPPSDGAPQQWINPQTFPPLERPLNMFLAI